MTNYNKIEIPLISSKSYLCRQAGTLHVALGGVFGENHLWISMHFGIKQTNFIFQNPDSFS